MEYSNKKACSSSSSSLDAELVRKGPWTLEEDMILMNYIANHGEGVWNSLAKQAGLKRTGKSCRLRWLNYLRPDVRRGNITAEEQLLIMDLHSKWCNRWSKIAKHLPGRTDNEIKNFWRTRIQKHVKAVPSSVVDQTNNNLSSSHSSSGSSSSSSSHIAPVVATDINMGPATHLLQPYHDHHHNMVPPTNIPAADSTNNNDNISYWNMEDFWSMHLLNGD